MEEHKDSASELTLQECQQRLRALETAFATAETKAQKYAREQEVLQLQLQSREKELHLIQADYESLRLQKGGFGFKAMLASGMAATLVGAMLCYLFFRPQSQHASTFEHFRRENQFQIEYAIGQGDFVKAEEYLKASIEKPEYQRIKPEIELVYKVISASKRRLQQD
jgi:hypothetical protein